MTHSKHSHHSAHHSSHHAEEKPLLRRLHKDWRAWLALGLMLAAIGMYVFSLDDSVQPGGGPDPGVPAASSTASPPK